MKFLHPNTTPLFKPMDQLVISNMKKLHTRALCRKCFEETNDTQLRRREFFERPLNYPERPLNYPERPLNYPELPQHILQCMDSSDIQNSEFRMEKTLTDSVA